MIDERICGNRNADGLTCQLLPNHPSVVHAGLSESCQVIVWPKKDDYRPQHELRTEGSK
jgi:hypothetical protein